MYAGMVPKSRLWSLAAISVFTVILTSNICSWNTDSTYKEWSYWEVCSYSASANITHVFLQGYGSYYSI